MKQPSHLLGLTIAILLNACVDDPAPTVELEESFATTLPARKLANNNQLKCNAKRSWNWFDTGYANNPLCVAPSAAGTCDNAQVRALQDRITKNHVKCPGCTDGEKGCEPRVRLSGTGPLGDVALQGGNCCLMTSSWGSTWFEEWCTTCVGTDCAAQDEDTGVCVDESEDADRTEPGVSQFPGE